MTTTWLLLLLVIDLHGHKMQQTVPFESKEACYEAIQGYVETLEQAKWDTHTHGTPGVMCMPSVRV